MMKPATIERLAPLFDIALAVAIGVAFGWLLASC